MTGDAYGFNPAEYTQIIVFDFDNQSDFRDVLAANPHMVALMGNDEYTVSNFPGKFVAGLKANQSQGISVGDPVSIQK